MSESTEALRMEWLILLRKHEKRETLRGRHVSKRTQHTPMCSEDTYEERGLFFTFFCSRIFKKTTNELSSFAFRLKYNFINFPSFNRHLTTHLALEEVSRGYSYWQVRAQGNHVLVISWLLGEQLEDVGVL